LTAAAAATLRFSASCTRMRVPSAPHRSMHATPRYATHRACGRQLCGAALRARAFVRLQALLQDLAVPLRLRQPRVRWCDGRLALSARKVRGARLEGLAERAREQPRERRARTQREYRCATQRDYRRTHQNGRCRQRSDERGCAALARLCCERRIAVGSRRRGVRRRDVAARPGRVRPQRCGARRTAPHGCARGGRGARKRTHSAQKRRHSDRGECRSDGWRTVGRKVGGPTRRPTGASAGG
jgi:hypothetical protein